MAWLPGYSKRQPLVLTGGASGAQTDFQLKLAVSYAAAMQGDFDDLRFTQADGTTLIDAWAELIVTDTSATVWAEFPTTPANTVEQTYYMYYGNVGTASDWDIEATFLLGDDFSSGVDWTNRWQSTVQALYAVAGGNLTLFIATPTTRCINSQNSFNNYIMEARHKVSGSSPCELHLEMSNAVASIPAKERTSLRVDTTFVGYVGGAYSTGGSGVNNTWYRSKIVVPSSGDATSSISSDNLVTTHVTKTGTPTYRTAYIAFFQYGSGTGYIDWVFVRKYAASPPTYAFGGEESAPVGDAAPTSIFYGPFVGPLGGPI